MKDEDIKDLLDAGILKHCEPLVFLEEFPEPEHEWKSE